MSLVMHAAGGGHMMILKLLVSRGGLLDSSHLFNGQTALHYAAKGNHKEIVEWLLEQGADPRCVNSSQQLPRDLTTDADIEQIRRTFK